MMKIKSYLFSSIMPPTQHPGCDGRHALHIGGVWCHDVEDVDEHEEEGDEHRHPAGDNLRGDQEADPGHHDKQARGQIVNVEILQHVTREPHLQTLSVKCFKI